MQRLSSNSTLLLKVFFPTFWSIFFGALALAFLFADYAGPVYLHSFGFKVGVLAFYVSGLAAIYFTIWRLKRVEIDEHFMYVTDYFKTARYPFHNVDEIKSSSFPFARLGRITLGEPGIFGKRQYFIHNKETFERVILNHPELLTKVVDGDEG